MRLVNKFPEIGEFSSQVIHMVKTSLGRRKSPLEAGLGIRQRKDFAK